MKTLIPVFLAILAIGTTKAQDASYASLSKDNTSSSSGYSVSRPQVNEPYIKITARTQTKIMLTWSPFKGAVSHYVLERSTDGHIFEEAGVLFTGDWETEPDYFYADKFRKPYAGPLFYRLRVVGLEGSVIYTPVTILNPAVAVN